ncbi:spaetzle domain-containing protein [Musca autumnalis]|uniref:spaetzle domain-containing protein n=1 Tax=Musca autumnalis TaxID=221902 RepID=UPI003CEC663E
MALFSTHLPVLLSLLFIFIPLLCVCSKIYTDVISSDTNGYGSSQPEAKGHNGSQLEENNTTKLIKQIFITDFPPGVTLFNNTTPIENTGVHFPDINDYAETASSHPKWTQPTTEAPTFKVSRDSNGKLNAVLSSTPGNNARKDSSHSNPSNNAPPIYLPTDNQLGNLDTTKSIDCLDGRATYCINVRNYPTETQVERILKERFNNLDKFFAEDIIPDVIDQRMNNDIDPVFCKTNKRFITPKAAMNKADDWVFIVNTEKYKQVIQVEECLNTGARCGSDDFEIQVPIGYTITCQQNYIYRNLVALNNGTVVPQPFKFPSCCKCVIIPDRQ